MPRLFLIYLLLPAMLQGQTPELSVPGHNLHLNAISAAQAHYPGFTGEGIRVSVKEYRFDSTDVDLRGRVLSFANAAANTTVHAGIIASLIAGAGNADRSGKGVAPGALVGSSSFIGVMPDPDYAGEGISVQNHSYGLDIQSVYDTRARAFDQSALDYPPLLHVFSAGNKGDSAATEGQYRQLPGFANLSGAFKMAKNALCVGAVDLYGQISAFSSRGPAYDGRIKPDLVAYGHDGSSGAAALVSGAAAVLQQLLFETADTLPDAALIRALLLNSAEDMGPAGPDYTHGFGNLNLEKALKNAISGRYLVAQASSGATLNFPIVAPPNASSIRVTLCWTDPPAAAGAPKALINDLNLRVLNPDGIVQQPLLPSVFPALDSLQLPARPGLDSLNNTEQIRVDLPGAGNWVVQVSVAGQLLGNQSFALAWDWDTLTHFVWKYPCKDASLTPAQAATLYWYSHLPETNTTLEWRFAGDNNWQTIAEADLQAGVFDWTPPDTLASVQVCARVGNTRYLSDNFMIATALFPKIGFNCPDSLMLYWSPAGHSAGYQLYGLGDRYMEPLMEVADTFVILQKSIFPQSRFAVAPVLNGMRGVRSAAPDIEAQGVACYFRTFNCTLLDDASVLTELELGTSYGIDSVVIRKWRAGAFETLNALPAEGIRYSTLDLSLQKGANTYRADVHLHNGQVLVSDPLTVYYQGEDGWWVFPNPVTDVAGIRVVTQPEETGKVLIYNISGQLEAEITLDQLAQEIPLPDLSNGLYCFKVLDGIKVIGAGRFAVAKK